MWVNTDFYDKYLVVSDTSSVRVDDDPITECNVFGTGASSSSDVAPTAANPITAREETHSDLAARIDKLFLEMSISKSCAMCLQCFAKEQVGTIWCYSCGNPMSMQEKLPLTHAQILSMVQDSSKSLLH